MSAGDLVCDEHAAALLKLWQYMHLAGLAYYKACQALVSAMLLTYTASLVGSAPCDDLHVPGGQFSELELGFSWPPLVWNIVCALARCFCKLPGPVIPLHEFCNGEQTH